MIIGCAIISRDGFLADAHHSMERIVHPVDFLLFQERMEKVPGVRVMGRGTYERHKANDDVSRFVLSSKGGAAKESLARFFSDEEVLLTAIELDRSRVYYVLGGGRVYSLFGRRRLYDAFYLSVQKDVALEDGIAIDSDAGFVGADQLMDKWGLRRDSVLEVDDKLEVVSYVWGAYRKG